MQRPPLLSFHVQGDPATQGSKVPVSRTFVKDDCARLMPWRQAVAWAAKIALNRARVAALVPAGVPLQLECRFMLKRPAAHYRKDGTLKPDAPIFCTKKPDSTKMIRAVEDAMTGVVYHDDSQIVRHITEKFYTAIDGRRGVYITIREADSHAETERP